MVPAFAIVGMLIFIYFNRYVQRKRDERREQWREKREEQLQEFFEAKKKHSSELNDEVSDTTKVK